MIRIVVLNYNGKDLLERCLPSIMAASKRSSQPCRVTVLDNQSKDDSESWVRANCPEADYVRSPSNRVFCSYNEYVESISDEFVILLNNDIEVSPDFVDPLILPLQERADLFFTAPQALGVDTEEYEGCLSKMEMRFGLIWGSATFGGFEKKVDKSGVTMQTGFGAFRRSFFVELEGFDDLFLPGTMEDADLCFRGYRRGWSGHYSPKSVVYHIGQASFKKAMGKGGIRRLNRRNLFLFVWKNVRDPLIMLKHILWIPIHLMKYVISGDLDFVLGFKDAVCRLPLALKKRRVSNKEKWKLKDSEIFKISEGI